jgi:hypothetical protein
MSNAIHRRGTGRTSRRAGAALRRCLALLLILQIVYTPIHLYLEAHSDEMVPSGAVCRASAADFVDGEGEEGDGHHERHSALQHTLKVLRSERAALPELVLVAVVECMDAEQDTPQPQVVDFSGLSPPELARCWQFFFRAALPVRAPSLIS